jgi:hypothetical protein
MICGYTLYHQFQQVLWILLHWLAQNEINEKFEKEDVFIGDHHFAVFSEGGLHSNSSILMLIIYIYMFVVSARLLIGLLLPPATLYPG